MAKIIFTRQIGGESSRSGRARQDWRIKQTGDPFKKPKATSPPQFRLHVARSVSVRNCPQFGTDEHQINLDKSRKFSIFPVLTSAVAFRRAIPWKPQGSAMLSLLSISDGDHPNADKWLLHAHSASGKDLSTPQKQGGSPQGIRASLKRTIEVFVRRLHPSKVAPMEEQSSMAFGIRNLRRVELITSIRIHLLANTTIGSKPPFCLRRLRRVCEGVPEPKCFARSSKTMVGQKNTPPQRKKKSTGPTTCSNPASLTLSRRPQPRVIGASVIPE